MTRLRISYALVMMAIGHPAFLAAQNPEPPSSANDSAIIAWIRRNAVPLQSLHAGTGFADLEPLKKDLVDVRIIGLGEATHGTSEFSQVKHRLLEFLVTQMGFTAFAMEASYSDAQPINDYIVHGTGDRATVLTGQGYVGWDTEELGAMIDWLRAYNKTVPEAKRVHFYGMDSYRNRVGRARVMSLVRRVAPERVQATDSLFHILAVQEAKWPFSDTTVLARSRPELASLTEVLESRRASAFGKSRPSEYEHDMQLLRVIRQSVYERLSSTMAENLGYIVDHERPGTKFVLWAHNWHVASHETQLGDPTMGYVLRRRYGNAYYRVGLEFDRGSYLSRLMPPPGDFKIGIMPPAPAGWVTWYLARAGRERFFLDLRATSRDSTVEQWLHAPRLIHAVNWGYSDPSQLYQHMPVAEFFDGIVFVAESTPTHPNPSAQRAATRGEGF